jgi:hypothetical protein
MIDKNDDYETDDIYLAAYLMLAGCQLLRRRKQGVKVYFIFVNPGGTMNEMREAYFSGKASVKPHDYAQKIIAVKNLCFE